MAQRKKKPTGHQLQEVANAHHKNEFLRKFKYAINICGGEDIYSLIPPKILDKIYIIRFHSLMIVPAPDNLMPNNLLNEQRRVLSAWLKKELFVVPQYGLKLILDDFLTVGLTLYSVYYVIADWDFPSAAKLKTALFKYCTDPEPYFQLYDQLFAIFQAMGWCICNLGIYLYWLNYEIKLADKGKYGMNNRVEIYIHKAERISIKINGAVRPAVRLGWAHPFEGLEWTTLKPSTLNIKDSLTDDPINVYVQSHALLRLAERIDSIIPSIAQYNMFSSFKDAVVVYDNNHNLLIEYRIFNVKAGYFRIDIVDGIVAVRTFLFLTQSGTPEGNLLGRNTGLKKLDKKYLAIDKLSTFMSSDISRNKQIARIFSDSGCGSLLELYENVEDICTKRSTQATCSLMLDYLGYKNATMPEAVFE